mgnify:CR=1 FL=1
MDGTEKQGDALLAGQPSPGETQETSQTAKTYTQEEVDKAINDALAAKGRDAKRLSEWEASLKSQQLEIEATKADIAEMQRRMDEAELEAARYDPDKLKEYQARKSIKDQMAELEKARKDLKRQQDELARSKAEHEAEVEAARKATLEIKLWEIAARYEVDPSLLKDLNPQTEEQAEKIAKRLSGLTKKPEGEKAKEFIPDSGVTIGAGGTPTTEQLDKMTPEQYAAWRKKGIK